MDFGTDYWNSLDKAKELRIDPRQIGISHGIGEVGEGLKANIFRGASIVELGFFGAGKGFRSQPTGHTPESYGRGEREEMRQLAKINEVELSTHASPNVGYAAGFSEGVFREEARTNVLHEVKRAVDFAADTAGGGPVVMHLGEFPRPVYEAEEKSFEAYKEEREKSPIYFVDEKTGQARILPRTTTFAVPQWEDEEKKIPKRNEKGELMWKDESLYELEKKYLEKIKKTGEKSELAKHLYETIMAKDLELTEFEVRRARQLAHAQKEEYEQVEKQVKDIKEDPDELRRKYNLIKFAENIKAAPRLGSEEYDSFLKDPEKVIKERVDDMKEQHSYWSQAESTYGRRREEMNREIGNIKPITDYGVKLSSDTIARAAMYAYEKEKKMELEKPLFIAPENWTPELYGSHPDELRRIIKESRDRMKEILQEQKKMSENEAKKVANEHIKATFDIGHLNFWRKFYKGSEDDFKDWVDDKVKELVKDGIIGHVHLSDNFGYHDEHLLPGEGNAPIQKFVERLKEAKFKGKLIAEPGGQKEGQHYRVWTESMKLLGSPVYRIDSTSRSWTDIESSYFGRVPQSPYFIVGDYAPSKDWTLWSETPLE